MAAKTRLVRLRDEARREVPLEDAVRLCGEAFNIDPHESALLEIDLKAAGVEEEGGCGTEQGLVGSEKQFGNRFVNSNFFPKFLHMGVRYQGGGLRDGFGVVEDPGGDNGGFYGALVGACEDEVGLRHCLGRKLQEISQFALAVGSERPIGVASAGGVIFGNAMSK